MTVNLFALTGFGNNALKALVQNQEFTIKKLYTREEIGVFPYYDEEPLDILANRMNIEVDYIDRKGYWDIVDDVDLNLVVTFHRIFKKEHLTKARMNINIHPSLLPSYKGPTPTNWMIYYGEKECGLTAHVITEKVDNGDIIYQKSYPLIQQSDSELREFLALHVQTCVEYLLAHFPRYNKIESPYVESVYSSYYK